MFLMNGQGHEVTLFSHVVYFELWIDDAMTISTKFCPYHISQIGVGVTFITLVSRKGCAICDKELESFLINKTWLTKFYFWCLQKYQEGNMYLNFWEYICGTHVAICEWGHALDCVLNIELEMSVANSSYLGAVNWTDEQFHHNNSHIAG